MKIKLLNLLLLIPMLLVFSSNAFADHETIDFGPNVHIYEDSDSDATIQAETDAIFGTDADQEHDQFGTQRNAVLFKPGNYNVNINIGFYTSVIGLGTLPDDVEITGSLRVEADWRDGRATQNFWRSVENMSLVPTFDSGPYQAPGFQTWAVSQAAPFRRMHIKGSKDDQSGVTLWDPQPGGPDNAYSSGGFIADSLIDGQIFSASQQQYYTRNSEMYFWNGSNWNMVLQGVVENAPPPQPRNDWLNFRITEIDETPLIREKPFLFFDEDSGHYFVRKPDLRTNSSGISWADGVAPGQSIPISDFYIVKIGDTGTSINAALAAGKHLIVTPGVYHLNETINITQADTIVLGMGLATFIPDGGIIAMTIADVGGVNISGLLFDAGTTESPVLVQVGPPGSSISHASNPSSLSDIFIRVGGTEESLSVNPARAEISLQINSNNVIGDNFWIWRADHSQFTVDLNRDNWDTDVVGWDKNEAANGLVVEGDNVTIYALFVEHYQEYQTVWNGNFGRLFFYQNELPYDPPSQAQWMNGSSNGWASYKVGDTVTNHMAIGMGVYSFFWDDFDVKLESAIEVPDTDCVTIDHAVTVEFLQEELGPDAPRPLTGAETSEITHIVNDQGAAATTGTLQTLENYGGDRTGCDNGNQPDFTPPSVPQNLAQVGTGSTVIWTASSDISGVAYYTISVDGVALPDIITTTSFDIPDLLEGQSYNVSVSATDGSPNANESEFSDPVTIKILDTTEDFIDPTVPLNLAQSGTSSTITWSASSDASGIDHYTVYIDGIGINIGNTTSYDTGKPTGTYSVAVSATDASTNANESESSAAIQVVVDDGTNALWEITVVKLGNGDMQYSITTDVDEAATEHRLFGKINGIQVLSWIEAPETVNTDGTHTYSLTHSASNYNEDDIIEVRFYIYSQALGQNFEPGPSDNDWTPPYEYGSEQDATPPSAPYVSQPSSTSSIIEWSASTDTSGIAHYTVYVDGVGTNVGNITSYEIPGLSSNEDYSVYVTATDGSANANGSDNSNVITVNVEVDEIGPSVPSNVQQSGSSSTVTWNASIDASGIAFYTVFVDGIGTNVGNVTSYDIPDLTPRSYSVSVIATDASANANESEASITIDIVIDDIDVSDYITVLGNGDVLFSVTYNFQTSNAQVFAKTNGGPGLDVAGGMAETNNGDGSYTYAYTSTKNYSSGDLIEVRFYGADGGIQYFTPGPGDNVWAGIIY